MTTRARRKDRFPRVRYHGELQAPSGFDSLVTVGMSLRGPVAIWSSRDGEAELHARYEQPPGGASFPRTDPSLLITGAIGDGTFHESQRASLRAPDGAPLPAARVHCRGSVAHFFAGANWSSFDLATVA